MHSTRIVGPKHSALPGPVSPRCGVLDSDQGDGYADDMDPSNPVVKGNAKKAAKLFEQAWTESTNDFERCIATHYVARHQPCGQLALHWNQEAMDCANRVPDGSVAEFLPSLYLNLGKSYEDLGNAQRARELYECAAARLGFLSPGAYRDIVEDGIRRALQRVAASVKSL